MHTNTEKLIITLTKQYDELNVHDWRYNNINVMMMYVHVLAKEGRRYVMYIHSKTATHETHTAISLYTQFF